MQKLEALRPYTSSRGKRDDDDEGHFGGMMEDGPREMHNRRGSEPAWHLCEAREKAHMGSLHKNPFNLHNTVSLETIRLT